MDQQISRAEGASEKMGCVRCRLTRVLLSQSSGKAMRTCEETPDPYTEEELRVWQVPDNGIAML